MIVVAVMIAQVILFFSKLVAFEAAWTQDGLKLSATGYTTGSSPISQGSSVALSDDGATLAVGAKGDNSEIGAVWVFTRDDVWSEEAKLVGSGYTGSIVRQGYSVSLSSDGNTLASGAPADDNSVGAVWIFVRSSNIWNQQGSKLIGTGYTVGANPVNQGVTTAISGDGNTVASGGNQDGGNVGAVWVFTRTSGSWSQQGQKLVGSGYTGTPIQASSMALSSDGTTLASCGPWDNSNVGAVWVFVRIGTTWSQEGSKLIGTGAVGAAEHSSVSLSSDGNTLGFGGHFDNSNVGAVWIFVRIGTTWSQEGSKLIGTGAVGAAEQGTSIFLSGDGNTVVSGGNKDGSNVGAVWVFTRTSGSWSQQGQKLVGSGYTGTPIQASSMALSSDGTTLASAGYGDDNDHGAVWVFTDFSPTGQPSEYPTAKPTSSPTPRLQPCCHFWCRYSL